MSSKAGDEGLFDDGQDEALGKALESVQTSSRSHLSDSQKARMERNRLKAQSLKEARLIERRTASDPYNKDKRTFLITASSSSSTTTMTSDKKVLDTGAGFFLEEEEEEETEERKLVTMPPPIIKPGRIVSKSKKRGNGINGLL